jgi:cytochrome d ubiquinol oxidase subunit I
MLLLATDPAQPPAREQMAFTLACHIILVPFGVALPFLMMAANYRGLRYGDRDALLLAERWSKVAHKR